jgi:hypothetical protein
MDRDGLVPWLFHTSFDGEYVPKDGASFTGEDYGFCDDYVKKYGEQIPVWTNFDFTHGGKDGNMFKWLTEQKDAHDANTSSAA